MAACLIDLTGGTAGTIRLDYDLGADHNIIYATWSDPVYIDDTATNVTYTTLTGDVTATSGCLTVTELPVEYYLFSYDGLTNDTSTYNSRFDAVLLDLTDVHALPSTVSDKTASWITLANEINQNLDEDEIKITAYKLEPAGSSENYTNVSLIMRIIGDEIPSLRILSHFDNVSYLIGTTSAAVPAGFTEIPVELLTPPV